MIHTETKIQMRKVYCINHTSFQLHSVMKKVQCLAKEVETLAGLCQDPYILCQVATGMEQLRDSLLPSSQSNEHYIEESEVSPPDSGQDKSKEGM